MPQVLFLAFRQLNRTTLTTRSAYLKTLKFKIWKSTRWSFVIGTLRRPSMVMISIQPLLRPAKAGKNDFSLLLGRSWNNSHIPPCLFADGSDMWFNNLHFYSFILTNGAYSMKRRESFKCYIGEEGRKTVNHVFLVFVLWCIRMVSSFGHTTRYADNFCALSLTRRPVGPNLH